MWILVYFVLCSSFHVPSLYPLPPYEYPKLQLTFQPGEKNVIQTSNLKGQF